MAHEIHLTPLSSELVRGASVSVPIRVKLDAPLKVRGIRARFHGAEETKADYTTTSTDSEGKTTTHHHTAVQLIDVVDRPYLLRGEERKGTFRNLGDGVATFFGRGKHELLDAGEYDFEVELQLPADAPATHVGQRSRVFYELSVEVDIPLARDVTAMHSFQVREQLAPSREPQPARVRYPDDQGRGFWDSMFAPDVKIDLALAKDLFPIGDAVQGMFSIEPVKPLNVRAIRVRLFGLERSTADSHTDSRTYQGEAIELAGAGSIEGRYSQEFAFAAEIDAPPTTRGRLFSIEWFVQVEFDVPWGRDPTIRVPVTLLPRGTTETAS